MLDEQRDNPAAKSGRISDNEGSSMGSQGQMPQGPVCLPAGLNHPILVGSYIVKIIVMFNSIGLC